MLRQTQRKCSPTERKPVAQVTGYFVSVVNSVNPAHKLITDISLSYRKQEASFPPIPQEEHSGSAVIAFFGSVGVAHDDGKNPKDCHDPCSNGVPDADEW
jgi:hypothetical protein